MALPAGSTTFTKNGVLIGFTNAAYSRKKAVLTLGGSANKKFFTIWTQLIYKQNGIE